MNDDDKQPNVIRRVHWSGGEGGATGRCQGVGRGRESSWPCAGTDVATHSAKRQGPRAFACGVTGVGALGQAATASLGAGVSAVTARRSATKRTISPAVMSMWPTPAMPAIILVDS